MSPCMLPAFARALTPIPGVRVVAARVTPQVRVAINLFVVAFAAETVFIAAVSVAIAAVVHGTVAVAGAPVVQSVAEAVLIAKAPRGVEAIIPTAVIVTVVAITVAVLPPTVVVLPPLNSQHILRGGHR